VGKLDEASPAIDSGLKLKISNQKHQYFLNRNISAFFVLVGKESICVYNFEKMT
jgi:hypothetical protein